MKFHIHFKSPSKSHSPWITHSSCQAHTPAQLVFDLDTSNINLQVFVSTLDSYHTLAYKFH